MIEELARISATLSEVARRTGRGWPTMLVLALAYGVAVVLDGALGNGIRVLRRVRHNDQDVDRR